MTRWKTKRMSHLKTKPTKKVQGIVEDNVKDKVENNVAE